MLHTPCSFMEAPVANSWQLHGGAKQLAAGLKLYGWAGT